MRIRTRTTTTVPAALAAAGIIALVAARGPAPAPGEHDASPTPQARSAHDGPQPATEGHLTLAAGTEVDLDTDDAQPVARTVDVAWDGDGLTLPTGAEIVDGVDTQECADVRAASAGSASAGGGTRPSAAALTIPAEVLQGGAEVCLRTDVGAVVHVEVIGPDINDDIQLKVYGQRAE
ncbi:hypothetical protein IF650_03795 [Cellulosimicrobium terreum]|nr:hypothetical protein [Cellulosimicrobium terreum]